MLLIAGDECKKLGKTFQSPFVKHEPKDTKKEKQVDGMYFCVINIKHNSKRRLKV